MTLFFRLLRLRCLGTLMVCLFFCMNVSGLDCNVTVNVGSSNREGEFSSSQFPSSYPKLPEAYSCWFTLIPDDPTKHIVISFNDFHLSSDYMYNQITSNVCYSGEVDYLAIRSSSTDSKHCGCRRPEKLIHVGGEVSLELSVQPIHITESSEFRGFRAQYQYLTAAEYMNLGDVYMYSAKPEFTDGYGTVLEEVMPLPAAVSPKVIDGLYYLETLPDTNIFLTAFIQNAEPGSGQLDIRDGLTSVSPLLHNGTVEEEIKVTSSQSALYIRWRGVIRDTTVTLKMEFTAFKEPTLADTCESNQYFYCKNHRCIQSTLTCNLVDNCGDSSDEANDNPTDICHVTNICDSSPCLNEGICSLPGPSCQCPFGFWGDICQYVNSDCMLAPCQNGGTCQPYARGPGFICFCLGNFHGPYCEDNILATCKPGDCNKGMCTDGKCVCRERYSGDHCEFFDNTTNVTDYTDLQHTSIMIGAFVGAVCLLSICWLIAMARKRQTDEPVGRVQRIVSVHSRDERGMRPSVTTAGPIDLPPNYSDCVFDETDSSQRSKRSDMPTIITEENEEQPDEDVFISRVEGDPEPPMSPPPTYEAVALEDDDVITFEASPLPDVVNRNSIPQRRSMDTTV